MLHDLNQACRYATHLIALRDGEIVAQGAPKEIVTPDLIARIYGMRCMIIEDPVAGTPLSGCRWVGGNCRVAATPYPAYIQLP